jgi:hypothetical protein
MLQWSGSRRHGDEDVDETRPADRMTLRKQKRQQQRLDHRDLVVSSS